MSNRLKELIEKLDKYIGKAGDGILDTSINADLLSLLIEVSNYLDELPDKDELYELIKQISGEACPDSPFGWRQFIAVMVAKRLEEGKEFTYTI